MYLGIFALNAWICRELITAEFLRNPTSIPAVGTRIIRSWYQALDRPEPDLDVDLNRGAGERLLCHSPSIAIAGFSRQQSRSSGNLYFNCDIKR
jgi:hypothetical protein